MSDAVQLDLREQIAQIDRKIEEGARSRAEQRKLTAVTPEPGRREVIARRLAVAAPIGGAIGFASFVSRLLGH